MFKEIIPFVAIAPSSIYSILSLFCANRYFSENHPNFSATSNVSPSITILKPVKGVDAGSYENFASFCNQNYGGVLQIVFAVASPDDPVISVVCKLQSDFPVHDISMVINPAIHGFNYKVSNLINAFPKCRHDIIIVCDSDIKVSPDYLQSVASHFKDRTVGLVTSLYRTSDVDGVAAAVEALGFTTEMIPNVLVALQLEGLSFALGASMAVRRKALADIGGFEALADYLADDYQLGNKVHRAGWKIRLDNCFVESTIGGGEGLMSVLSRQLRWARTMRVSRPGGYFASGITLAFPALLVAAIFAPTPPIAITAITVLYVIRMIVSTIYSKRFVRDSLLPSWLWLLPVRDMLTFFCWGLSFLGNRVQWRGSRFRLISGGKLEELV